MIKAMPNMETNGMALSSHPALPLKNLLNKSPAVMGIITILIISHIISRAFICINAPAYNFIKKGVIRGASIVDTAVMVIDRARFALAR